MFQIREGEGKRRPGQVVREAWNIMWTDIKNYWVGGAVFAGYFLFGRLFLYSLCPMVVVTGFPCPACGMTRAVLSILKGNFAAAWYLHPFSYAFLLFLIVFAVRRYILKMDVKCLAKYAAAGLIGLIIYYIYRMIRYFPGDAPMSYYYGSLGYRIFSVVFH